MHNTRGFTLIELMIVVVIIDILATMAIPAYQTDTIRAQVVEAFSLAASELKGAIQEYRVDRGQLPADNTAAGLAAPQLLIGNYVTRFDIVNGNIHVTFGNLVNRSIEGKVLTLQPLVVPGSPMSPMSWRCGLPAIPMGMQTVGENRTNLDGMVLPSACGA